MPESSRPRITAVSECSMRLDDTRAIASVHVHDWILAMEDLKDTVVAILTLCSPNAQQRYLRAFHSIPKDNENEALFLAILTYENQAGDYSWAMGASSDEWDRKVIELLNRFATF